MTKAGGYAVAPYGGGPYGGSVADTPEPVFDLFCFEDLGMYTILDDPRVSTVGIGSHFILDPVTLDLEIVSGGSLLMAEDAQLRVTENIPQTFTVQWEVKFSTLPNDFSDIVNSHVYLGCYDAGGPLVGLFISKIGVAYTGSVSFPGGNLQLDCTFQPIPGSASYVSEGDYWVIRVAADLSLGVIYFYMTKQDDLPSLGHQLRAILPVIPYTAAATPPTDGGIISIRGTSGFPISATFDSFCAGTSLIIPNLAPVASAGQDQAVRMCSIVRLDGSQSFDPEGAPLLYRWRLIDGPITSGFVIEKYDGVTYPEPSPTGFTDRVYSATLGTVDALDPIATGSNGDVLWINATAYVIVATGTHPTRGFYVQIGSSILPDNLSAAPFKVLRQRGLSGPTTVTPSFFPDTPGFYRFDLTVSDGNLISESSEVIANVLESPLPRGCTPDLSFIFNYLSDFWDLVEGRERIAVFWSALAQVAATELYTLWQFEYSKSLRDIQRTFARRWLHYDLLLAEPLPELTKIRAIYGGVTSAFFSVGGTTASGLKLEVESDTLAETASVTVLPADPVTADVLAAELEAGLQEFDSRFTVTVLENRTTTELAVRIDAPFPFAIGAGTTLTQFTVGDEDLPPSGAGGSVVSAQAYKTNRSLADLDIQEDDFLTLDGVSYRIARIIDSSTDPYPFQRVLVKEVLPISASATWKVSGWVSSELLNFYDGLVSEGDVVDFEVSEISGEKASKLALHDILTTTALGAAENHTSRLPIDVWPLGGHIADEAIQVFLARVVRRRYVPVDDLVVDIPTLQRLIVIEDDEETLRRNVDYFIESTRGHNAVRFACGATGDLGDIWEGERPPNRLWAEYTYLDNSPLIENNFGYAVGFTKDQVEEFPANVDYLGAVRGLWYALFNGPTIRNLRIGTQILLGLPFAEEAGTIEELRTDYSPNQGRILIRDAANTQIVRSYFYSRLLELEVNPATGARYAVGDTVDQFAPLVEGAEIIDYITDPTWFQGLMSQGILYEVEKFHKFVVRVDSVAFNLTSLLFVKNFILKIKPTYTYPLFIIQKKVGDTEVSTTDEVSLTVSLNLHDGVCEHLIGAVWMYDEPRAAGGGWRNQFDADVDPTTPPVWPTPESPIRWAYDKMYLCPADSMSALMTYEAAAPFLPFYDGPFVYDTNMREIMHFEDAIPGTIPAPPGGYAMTVVGDNVVDFDGTITKIGFIALGDPGSDPTDYIISVYVNGTEEITETFTDGTNTEVVFTESFALSDGDTVDVYIIPASGASSRSPNWSWIRAYVFIEDAVWKFDGGDPPVLLDPGTYCSEKVL